MISFDIRMSTFQTKRSQESNIPVSTITISEIARIVSYTAVDVTLFLFLLSINIVKLFPNKHTQINTGEI